jgi:hypothetical protein
MKSFKRNLFFLTIVSLFIFIAACHNHSDYVAGNSQYARQSKIDTTVNGAVKTKGINDNNKPAEEQLMKQNDEAASTAVHDSTVSANHSDTKKKKDSAVKK